MPRRGRSTTIGKIARVHHDRRVSEIRVLGERLREQQRALLGPAVPSVGDGVDSAMPVTLSTC